MKYFKMIKNNEFVGAISSDDFISYIPNCGYMRTNEDYGEYVEYNNQYYRATWMKVPHTLYNYEEVTILPIDENEYNAFIEAIESNEVIIIDNDEELPPEPIIDPIDQESLEFIRNSKITAMSYACRMAIENGFDIELQGGTRHFSLTTQDQLNLMNLSIMAQTQQLIPYHADGEACEFYTAEEINLIATTATQFKIYHTTYYNALKEYINTLETIEEIATITYGIEIPEDYKTDVLKILES